MATPYGFTDDMNEIQRGLSGLARLFSKTKIVGFGYCGPEEEYGHSGLFYSTGPSQEFSSLQLTFLPNLPDRPILWMYNSRLLGRS
jgi:hypothetical protein